MSELSLSLRLLHFNLRTQNIFIPKEFARLSPAASYVTSEPPSLVLLRFDESPVVVELWAGAVLSFHAGSCP